MSQEASGFTPHGCTHDVPGSLEADRSITVAQPVTPASSSSMPRSAAQTGHYSMASTLQRQSGLPKHDLECASHQAQHMSISSRQEHAPPPSQDAFIQPADHASAIHHFLREVVLPVQQTEVQPPGKPTPRTTNKSIADASSLGRSKRIA